MSDFLFGVPRYVLQHTLRSERAKEGFSDPAVRVSLLLDVDASRVRSQREYARIWGWSRSKVRHHWEEVWHDVARWVTSNGRQLDPARNPLAGRLPPEWLAWAAEALGPEGAETPPEAAQPTAHEQPTHGPPSSPKNRHDNPKNPHQQPTHGPPSSPPAAHNSSSHPTSLNESESAPRGRAREAAVAVYERVVGRHPGIWPAERIAAAVGEDPDRLGLWEAVCVAWLETPGWNERQPLKMLDDFGRQLERLTRETDEPEPPNGDTTSPTPRGRRAAAERGDPGAAYERRLAVALAAQDLGDPGVGGDGDAP